MRETGKNGRIWRVAEDRWSSTVDAASTSIEAGSNQSGEINMMANVRQDVGGSQIIPVNDVRPDGDDSAPVVLARGIVPLVVVESQHERVVPAGRAAPVGTAPDSLLPVVSLSPTSRPPASRPATGASWGIAFAAFAAVTFVLAAFAVTQLQGPRTEALTNRQSGQAHGGVASATPALAHVAPRK
jgi:hypothetical protein